MMRKVLHVIRILSILKVTSRLSGQEGVVDGGKRYDRKDAGSV